jgi:hypothetical protein
MNIEDAIMGMIADRARQEQEERVAARPRSPWSGSKNQWLRFCGSNDKQKIGARIFRDWISEQGGDSVSIDQPNGKENKFVVRIGSGQWCEVVSVKFSCAWVETRTKKPGEKLGFSFGQIHNQRNLPPEKVPSTWIFLLGALPDEWRIWIVPYDLAYQIGSADHGTGPDAKNHDRRVAFAFNETPAEIVPFGGIPSKAAEVFLEIMNRPPRNGSLF